MAISLPTAFLEKTAVPEHLRIAAITMALVSVVLLALAVGGWPGRDTEGESDSARRYGWRGNVLLFLISIGLVGSLWAVAAVVGWNRDRTLWVGLGAFLGLATLARPWWFWENYRARWLRNVIGDGATIMLYLAVAGMMVWVGLNTNLTFGRR